MNGKFTNKRRFINELLLKIIKSLRIMPFFLDNLALHTKNISQNTTFCFIIGSFEL